MKGATCPINDEVDDEVDNDDDDGCVVKGSDDEEDIHSTSF